MLEKDTYKTITKPSAVISYKDKNSKFYGYAFPIKTEGDVKFHIDDLKKRHHAARHWCYAYQIGTDIIKYRVNDDGEPNNSAGMPIYGQIQAYDLTNILIVVVRYFGGVKLGVGGLIQAYRTTAQQALYVSKIVERTVKVKFLVIFDYNNMNKVMRIIKDKNLKIIDQNLELQCEITVAVRKKEAHEIFEIFNNIYQVTIKK